jgi:8-oxo-dGTP pyrophosphatase MutT (NUDIX family)
VRYAEVMSAVVLACIYQNHRLFVAQRLSDPYRGAMEVPGGKVEAHESYAAALARELKEELNLSNFKAELYFTHQRPRYPTLIFFIVEPKSPIDPLVYDRFEWVDLNRLDELAWIEHNHPLLPRLAQAPMVESGPRCYVYPSDDEATTQAWIERYFAEATTRKKHASVVFVACYQNYVERYPDFMLRWSGYLKESASQSASVLHLKSQ